MMSAFGGLLGLVCDSSISGESVGICGHPWGMHTLAPKAYMLTRVHVCNPKQCHEEHGHRNLVTRPAHHHLPESIPRPNKLALSNPHRPPEATYLGLWGHRGHAAAPPGKPP